MAAWLLVAPRRPPFSEVTPHRCLALAAIIGIVGCGEDPTALADPDYNIEIVGGNGQAGAAGWALLDWLTVRVTDDEGVPAVGTRVWFAVTAGDGSVSAVTQLTDGSGQARTRWTLGSSASFEQRLRASLDGEANVTFAATALAPHEVDLVVARGALGPLKGAVLARDIGLLEVIGVQALADTLIPLPPIQESGVILVVFGYANRPVQVAPTWTAGVDTVHVELLPRVEVDIHFEIRDGSYAAQVQRMNSQLTAMEEIWDEEGMGIVLGEVTFVDRTSQGELHIPIPDTCPQDVADALQVRVLSSIGGQTTTGWACASGDVWLGRDFSLSPLLLAHEVGHTFALIHQDTGLMSIGPMRTDPRDVRDGETYRAHFHQASALNRIFSSQPLAQHRNCSAPYVCLPETLDTREE